MMSKERLEEIEAKYSTLTVANERGGIEYTEVDIKDLVFLIQNGFNQAERVQDLEEDKNALGVLIEKTAKIAWNIEQQNKRYKQALEFYANEENYELDISYNPAQAIDCMILDDIGHQARKALEGESE